MGTCTTRKKWKKTVALVDWDPIRCRMPFCRMFRNNGSVEYGIYIYLLPIHASFITKCIFLSRDEDVRTLRKQKNNECIIIQ